MMLSNAGVDVVRAAYSAFGRGDIPAIVDLLSEDVDWTLVGARRLAYTGRFEKSQVAQWFGHIWTLEEVQGFEPREFIPGGEHVTVRGWERCAARATGKVFEAEWVHIFTVKNGKITRFFGIYDTEAAAAAHA